MTSFVISDIFYYKVIPFKLNDATTTYQLTSHHCNKDNMCSYSDHRLHFLSGHCVTLLILDYIQKNLQNVACDIKITRVFMVVVACIFISGYVTLIFDYVQKILQNVACDIKITRVLMLRINYCHLVSCNGTLMSAVSEILRSLSINLESNQILTT